jgi:hypothetical protein
MKVNYTLNVYKSNFIKKFLVFISEVKLIFKSNYLKRDNVSKIFLIFIFLHFFSVTHGQTVSGAAVQANLGIDADI